MSWWDDTYTPPGEDPYYWNVESLRDGYSDDPTFDAATGTDEEAPATIPLDVLTDKQRFVVECFFGIGRPPQTEGEIAKYMGISQVAVHKLKKRALKRLRGVIESA